MLSQIERKIAQFNFLNATALQKQHLFCVGCDDWLLTTIYQDSDGQHYCEICSTKTVQGQVGDKSAIPTNNFLEDLRKNLKYPCKYCDFIGILCELIQHIKVCLHRPLKCLFCGNNDLHELNSAKHLIEQHYNEVIIRNIDERNVTLKLQMPITEPTICILNYKENYFIIKVELLNGTLTFLIAQQAIEGIPLVSNFAIIFESGYTKTTLNAKVCQIKSIFESHTHDLNEKLNLRENEDNIEVKFDFSEQGKLLIDTTVDECSICYNILTTEIYQCRNGHSICTNCNGKINTNTCPTCRLPMHDVPLSLKHVLSSYYFSCKNAEDGCLHVAKQHEMEDHLIDCVHRSVHCEDCADTYLMHKSIHHVSEKHDIYNNFMLFGDTLHKNKPVTRSAKLKYKHNIFCFVWKYALENTISVYVRLLHCKNKSVAEKFRYEVHVIDLNKNVIGKGGNVCQIASDKMNTCTIDLKICNKYISRNDTEWKFILRCLIFDIEI